MRRLTILFLALATLAAGSWQLRGDPPPQQEKKLKPIMEQKIGHAKELLEGLATEDFERVSRNAQALSLLSLESGWNVLVTEEYLKQSNAFRRSLDSIRDGAEAKNVDRAVLGYVDMTIRCVECHKYVRQNQAKIANGALDE